MRRILVYSVHIRLMLAPFSRVEVRHSNRKVLRPFSFANGLDTKLVSEVEASSTTDVEALLDQCAPKLLKGLLATLVSRVQ